MSSLRQGSSPLARGLRRDECVPAGLHRIIPARAGFTVTSHKEFSAARDHPRSRGVYSSSHRPWGTSRGSSPLARGLRWRRSWVPRFMRIIPARAGFTRISLGISHSGTDHPRSRGVYAVRHAGRPVQVGSSPLARGLRAPLPCSASRPGIIPARAGFTSVLRKAEVRRPDHPRSRGVYLSSFLSWRLTRGSSPLARGLQLISDWQKPLSRIIPARAGFTRVQHVQAPPVGDHPRSRGVYWPGKLDNPTPWGSSPLARGLPALHLL